MSEVDTRERTVYMLVDLGRATPVAGPYLDLEHSRDAWHFLLEEGVRLSHLQLVVRDRQDLVKQVQLWRVGYLEERQRRRLAAPCRGCES